MLMENVDTGTAHVDAATWGRPRTSSVAHRVATIYRYDYGDSVKFACRATGRNPELYEDKPDGYRLCPECVNLESVVARVSVPGVRKPCAWPRCRNTVPATWQFCSDRRCQSERLTARHSDWVDGREVTAEEREVLDARLRRIDEQCRKWNASPARREAVRRWKAANPERIREQRRRYYERVAGARAWLRRQQREIELRNAKWRTEEWERAKQVAGEELLLLIEEQENDRDFARRMASDPWMLSSLDAVMPGTSNFTLADALSTHGGGAVEWQDPTAEVALFLIELEERAS